MATEFSGLMIKNWYGSRGRRMTERQFYIYEFIVQFTKEHLYPPTVAEIAKAVSLKSKAAAFEHLMTLEGLGYIKYSPGISRGITLIGYELRKATR